MGIRDGGIRYEEGFESGGCVLVRDGGIRFEISEEGGGDEIFTAS
jgi:hypothetical protein